jgi:hypothetical protein
LVNEYSFSTAAFYVTCCADSKDVFYDESSWPEGSEVRDWVLLSQIVSVAVNQLRMCSYNLHGFNSGVSYLKELCGNSDILFMQKHWLQKSQLDKFNSIDQHCVFCLLWIIVLHRVLIEVGYLVV